MSEPVQLPEVPRDIQEDFEVAQLMTDNERLKQRNAEIEEWFKALRKALSYRLGEPTDPERWAAELVEELKRLRWIEEAAREFLLLNAVKVQELMRRLKT